MRIGRRGDRRSRRHRTTFPSVSPGNFIGHAEDIHRIRFGFSATSQPERPAEASAPTRSISGFIAPIPNITSSVPEVPTVPQQDPFPLLDQPLDEPMLNDLPPHPPQLLPQAHHLPSHQTPSYQQHSHQPPFHQPQLRRPTPTPETVEADARSAMWHEHGETMKQIKDNVDSLLATLWARDADPRELRGMFESLREEVGRTRERLLQ